MHYTVKAIYTRGDLQSIISKNCELLSAQHHTLISRGCLILFHFVISSLRIPCLFAQYVLIVTGSTCTGVPIQEDWYRIALPRLLIHLGKSFTCIRCVRRLDSCTSSSAAIAKSSLHSSSMTFSCAATTESSEIKYVLSSTLESIE